MAWFFFSRYSSNFLTGLLVQFNQFRIAAAETFDILPGALRASFHRAERIRIAAHAAIQSNHHQHKSHLVS